MVSGFLGHRECLGRRCQRFSGLLRLRECLDQMAKKLRTRDVGIDFALKG
jgi:hypothetical protein